MAGGSVTARSGEVRIIAWALHSDTALRVRRAAQSIEFGLTEVEGTPDPIEHVDGVDVLVVDGSSPDWLGVVARITEQRPGVRPFLIGDLSGPEEFISALSAGVVGVCPRDASEAAIERSIRSIVQTGVAIPRTLTKPLVDAVRQRGGGHIVQTAAGEITVTDREWEVLQMLLQRRSTAEMADNLFVSVGTVRSHVSTLLRKLGAVDREDVIALVTHGGHGSIR